MMQIVKMSRKGKIALYMTLPKKKIAEMLATCNETIEAMRPVINGAYPALTGTTNAGRMYVTTVNATPSFATGESKSGATRKKGVARKRHGRVGKQKRRSS